MKLVRLSLRIRTFWPESTRTSALKKIPAAEGLVSVVNSRVSLGIILAAWQGSQFSVTCLITVSALSMKKFLLKSFNI